MNRIVVLVAIIFIIAGIFVYMRSESYTTYYNTVTEDFQSYPNPSTVRVVISPTSNLGISIFLIGIMALIIGFMMPKTKTS